MFLVFANGFFVAGAFALVKVRSTQLDEAVASGRGLATTARALLTELDSYLSATQLGITLTSLGLGWIGEPAVAKLLHPLLEPLHLPEETLHRVSFVVGFSLISFLHIVLGEVTPKSLAIARPVGVSMAVAWPLRIFHAVTLPALWVLNASSALILRLFGVEAANTHTLAIGGDEFVRMAEQSAAEGSISEHEGELVNRVFAFSSRVRRRDHDPAQPGARHRAQRATGAAARGLRVRRGVRPDPGARRGRLHRGRPPPAPAHGGDAQGPEPGLARRDRTGLAHGGARAGSP